MLHCIRQDFANAAFHSHSFNYKCAESYFSFPYINIGGGYRMKLLKSLLRFGLECIGMCIVIPVIVIYITGAILVAVGYTFKKACDTIMDTLDNIITKF